MSLEADDELRRRLLYVAGDTDATQRRIHLAKGAELDVLAEEVGIRRRGEKEKSPESYASDGWAVPWR